VQTFARADGFKCFKPKELPKNVLSFEACGFKLQNLVRGCHGGFWLYALLALSPRSCL